MMDRIPAGARFVLLSGTRGLGFGLNRADISDDLIGVDIDIQAFAGGRESALQAMPYAARHLRPFSPVHGQFNPKTGGLTWIRRSRINNDKWTGLDIPIGEVNEAYHVEIFDGEALLHSEDVGQQSYTLPLSFKDRASHVTISQGSDIYGLSLIHI